MVSLLFFLIGQVFMNFLNFKNKLILNLNIFLLMFFLCLFNFFMINNFNNWMFIYKFNGMDKISILLVILSIWVCLMMLISMFSMNLKFLNLLIFLLLMMLMFLLNYFYSMNLIYFYIYFECSLIPILLMILGWGIQPERLQAGLYMFMHTMILSMPFFFMLMMMVMNLNTMNFLF